MSGGFEDFGLMPELVAAISEMGWILPKDVQDETIPLMLGGGDVMVAAETGSGKTGAFGIPVLQLVHEIRKGVARTSSSAAAGVAPAAAAAAGGGGGAAAAATELPCCLNTKDRSEFLTVSPDGLMCQTREPVKWGGVRATVGISAGKYYYEVAMRDAGLCRMGWSTGRASLELGTDVHGYGFGGTGKKSNNNRFDTYGTTFGNGDVIGCSLDFDGKQISYSVNGTMMGPAFDLPATQAPLFPAFCMKNGELAVNFGLTAFLHAPPGFTGVVNVDGSHCVRPPTPAMTSSSLRPPAATGSSDVSVCAPLALILEPTRELALQTAQVMADLMRHVAEPALRLTLLMGGMDTRDALAELRRGTDVVVATPGLLADLVKSGKLNLSCVRVFVIDEADRMTDAENLKVVMDTFAAITKDAVGDATPVQVCLFSATLHSPEIANLSQRICNRPTWVDLKGKDAVPETVFHLVIPVDAALDTSWLSGPTVPTDGVHASDRKAVVGRGSAPAASLSDTDLSLGCKYVKPRLLVALADGLRMSQCLVFCRTNVDCDNLEKYLTALGGGRGFVGKVEKGKENAYSCCVMAGMRSMQERLASLQAFHDGDVRFLICTDLAARGLDIKGLPFVVNMTLPDESENYIHRIGRVGRADRLGLALSLVSTHREKVWYHKCANRGRGCSNTALLDKGGCTIWYDEPAMLQSIEKRLGKPIETMVPVAVPGGSVPAAAAAGPGAGASPSSSAYSFTLPEWATGLTFGFDKAAPQETSDHITAIAPTVESLVELERQAQLSFLDIKARFHRPAGSSA